MTIRLGSIGGNVIGEVSELPGCIASGESIDELLDKLRDLIRMTISEGNGDSAVHLPLPVAGMASTAAGCTVWLELGRPLG